VRRIDPKLLLLPLVSGLLSFASFPALGQSYLAWVAQVPLLLFMLRSRGALGAFLGGMLAGFVQFALLLVWIPAVLVNYGGIQAAVAWSLFALLMAALAAYPGLACAATGIAVQKGGRALLLIFPFAWVAVELLRNYTPFGGFPWMLAGYSQTGNLRIMQVADIAGVYGVSFLILAVNTGIAWLLRSGMRRLRSYVPLLCATGLVTLCLAYGNLSLGRWDKLSPRYTAALLQANISADEPDEVIRHKFEQGYLDMAAQIRDLKVDLVVLPESPAPKSFQSDAEYRRSLTGLARHYSLGIIVSNVAFAEAPRDSRYFNSAYFLDQEGRVRGRYDKIHLVPFGEYVPLKSVFFFLQSITQEASDFSPGSELVKVDTPAGTMNAIICFEAVFPELVRRFVEQGSQLVVNLTNDSWYGDSAAPYQHLAMARWRAVENRRYLLRAANSGISAIIDPAGRITVTTGLLRQDICLGRFDFLAYESFYTRRGDVAAVLCAIIVILALAWSFHRSARSGYRPGSG
jgi:apolipoprotein N-acyltransferase